MLQLQTAIAGTITHVVADSIQPYRTNQAATGKYTFTFKIATRLTTNPILKIGFPSIFPIIMANTNSCAGSVQVMLTSQKKNITCSVVINELAIDLSAFPFIDAGNIVVVINDVLNPAGADIFKKSSGNFSIRTYSGLTLGNHFFSFLRFSFFWIFGFSWFLKIQI